MRIDTSFVLGTTLVMIVTSAAASGDDLTTAPAQRIQRAAADLVIDASQRQQLAAAATSLQDDLHQLSRLEQLATAPGSAASQIEEQAAVSVESARTQYARAAMRYAASLDAALDDQGMQAFHRLLLDELWYRGVVTTASATAASGARDEMIDEVQFVQDLRARGLDVEQSVLQAMTLLEMEGKGEKWRAPGTRARPPATQDLPAADVVMVAPATPTGPPPWLGKNLGTVNQQRIASLLTLSSPQVVHALATEVVPQVTQQIAPGGAQSAGPTAVPLAPISGWCCRRGRLFGAVDEACCTSVGGWYAAARAEAQAHCQAGGEGPGEPQGPAEPYEPHEPGEPHPPEGGEHGWCCVNGELFPAPEHVCEQHGGRIFWRPEEAEMHCRPGEGPGPGEPPGHGHPYEPGEPHEPHEPGEPYEPHQPEEPHEAFEPHEPGEPEHGWCCVNGEVFPAPEHDCRQHGGRFFWRPEEAEMHCRPGEGPEEPHEPGEPYEPYEPAEPHEPGEPHEPYDPGTAQVPGEEYSRACCLDREVIPGISDGCCRSLGGLPIDNDQVSRTHCEQGTPE
jgi:hypothetical protein